VVDTNIMFSFFWKDSLIKKLLMDQEIILFSPEFALEEIKKYEKEIMRKAKINKKEFNSLREELAIAIEFVSLEEYKGYLKKALKVSPDENDLDFFALALKLKIPLWSNDKLLKKQNILKVLETKDVFREKIMTE
jgi:predicted nucleic acid-binding protein